MAKKIRTPKEIEARLEHRRAYQREYYKSYFADPAHPERAEKRRASARKQAADMCVDQRRKQVNDRYWKDPERARAKARERNARCRAKKRANGDKSNSERATAWATANPEKRKLSMLVTNCRRHGITAEQYVDMLEKQAGVCAICGRPETHKGRKNLSIDHAHSTGYDPHVAHAASEVRGLLCHSCNLALGLMQDDTTRLLNAAEYLMKHKTPAATT